MKISIYVRNSTINPSAYYRICQYTNDMDYDIRVREAVTNKIYNISINSTSKIIIYLSKIFMFIQSYLRINLFLLIDLVNQPDVFFIQREIFPRYSPFYIRNIMMILSKKSKIIWDFDDDILRNGEISSIEIEVLSKLSSHIIVTNNYLKETLNPKVQSKVVLLPTTDGDIYDYFKNYNFNQRIELYKEKIVLLWIGTSNNIKYLKDIIKELDFAAKKLREMNNKQLILRIVSGKEAKFDIKTLKVENINWSRTSVVDSIKTSHIGIMPLPDTNFAKGKGSFKLIQYLAGGLPILASKIGFNKEVVNNEVGLLIENNDEWAQSILFLSSLSEYEYITKCEKCLSYWKKQFSYSTNLKVFM